MGAISRQQVVVGIGIVVLVALLASAKFKTQPSNPNTTNSANGSLTEAVLRLSQAESYHTQINLQLHLPPLPNAASRPFPEVALNLDGDVRHQEKTPEFSGQLHAEAKGQGSVLFTNGEIRILANGVYFNLDTLPALLDPTGSLTHKWTFVDTKLLRTNNPEDVARVVNEVVARLQPDGAKKYSGTLSAEDEQKLQDVLQFSASGNQAYNTVARLLKAFDTNGVTLILDDQGNVAQLSMVFHEPKEAATKRAELTITWQDFGKSVAIDPVEPVSTAPPQVFGQFFGVTPLATPTPVPSARKR